MQQAEPIAPHRQGPRQGRGAAQGGGLRRRDTRDDREVGGFGHVIVHRGEASRRAIRVHHEDGARGPVHRDGADRVARDVETLERGIDGFPPDGRVLQSAAAILQRCGDGRSGERDEPVVGVGRRDADTRRADVDAEDDGGHRLCSANARTPAAVSSSVTTTSTMPACSAPWIDGILLSPPEARITQGMEVKRSGLMAMTRAFSG